MPIRAKVLLIVIIALAATCRAQDFSDIGNDPRSVYINRVGSMRIMQGYPDGTFRPNAMVTEREFADIIDRMLVANPQLTKPKFEAKNPEEPVTRLRAAIVIIRAVVEKSALESITNPNQILARFSDSQQIPEWGRKDAAYAVDRGILTGADRLEPSRPITRAELAELLSKCLPPAVSDSSPEVLYTGLVVDCTGLKLTRSMCPAIESESHTKIYPDMSHLPSIEFLEDHGLVSYFTDQAPTKRVGEKPLVVKAVGISGNANQVAVVSDADKDAILEAEKTCHFLANWSVAFKIDPR